MALIRNNFQINVFLAFYHSAAFVVIDALEMHGDRHHDNKDIAEH